MVLKDAAGPRKVRSYRYKNIVRVVRPEFINPYPWMSAVEAMVHLELERRRIPFAWRYFDGHSDYLDQLVPGWVPEFTLLEYKTVIHIVGEWWGTLPGVVEEAALAQVCLEEDGWRFLTLFGRDIESLGADRALHELAPDLSRPHITGGVKDSPYDPPTYMQELRRAAGARALRRSKFAYDETDAQKEPQNSDTRSDRRSRRTSRQRRSRRSYRRSSYD